MVMITPSDHIFKHKYCNRCETPLHKRCAYGQLFPTLCWGRSSRSVVPRESDVDGDREYRHVGKEWIWQVERNWKKWLLSAKKLNGFWRRQRILVESAFGWISRTIKTTLRSFLCCHSFWNEWSRSIRELCLHCIACHVRIDSWTVLLNSVRRRTGSVL